ncbi:MAG: anti-sigma F factor [Thermaerobacter sp.]|jgi:stage II sporulation protein AB (anti-sigma F factor)|nr:anti-sigma F factor [Thermaerobacter sp.]
MRLELASRAENVGVARVAVAAFAGPLGFTLGELEEIKVAVSEAVSNAVLHGYLGAEGTVRIEAEAAEGALELVVEDQGRGIEDVAQARRPAFSTDPERMGLGFVFMESFSDSLEVSSSPGQGTRVRMRKRPTGNPGRQ